MNQTFDLYTSCAICNTSLYLLTCISMLKEVNFVNFLLVILVERANVANYKDTTIAVTYTLHCLGFSPWRGREGGSLRLAKH